MTNRIILVVDMLSGTLCALAGLVTLAIGVAVLNGSMSIVPMSILSAPVDQFTAGLMLTAAGFVAAGSSIGMCARSLSARRRVVWESDRQMWKAITAAHYGTADRDIDHREVGS